MPNELHRSRYHRLFVLAVVLGCLPTARPSASPDPAGQAGHDHARHAEHATPPADTGGAAVRGPRHIPDLRLLDQEGREVDFYSDLVADKIVAMNFIFTTCTTVCRPMGAIFAKLQRQLGDRVGRDVHLISVSVDPLTDRPQRLKAWAEQLGAGPGWTLVTGEKTRVDELLKSLEVFTPDFADHSPTVLVGNARTGSWQRTYGLAPVAKLAELIDGMLAQDGDGAAEGQGPPPAEVGGRP